MKGEQLLLRERWCEIVVVPELAVGVTEMHQEVSGGKPPNNDGLLNEERETTYELRGANSISGELVSELMKRVAGNVVHVSPEELGLNPNWSNPSV